MYDDVTAAFNWQTRKKATEMAEKGIEEDFIWVEWVEKKVLPTDVKVGQVLPKHYEIGKYLYPNENSDYVSAEGKNDILPDAITLLKSIVEILNIGYEGKFFSTIKIDITYNCGSMGQITLSDCENRAKKAVNHTIRRLIEYGLKIPKASIIIGKVNALQIDKAQEGRSIQITPLK